jgi:outer membrane cobalamin receptor
MGLAFLQVTMFQPLYSNKLLHLIIKTGTVLFERYTLGFFRPGLTRRFVVGCQRMMLAVALFVVGSIAQSQNKVSGFVRDAQTGEALAGANVLLPGSGNGTTTNTYGFFSLTMSHADHELTATFIGYSPINLTLAPKADTLVTLLLLPGYTIGEATVTAKAASGFLSGNKAGHYELSGAALQIPTLLLGEPDVMKVLQTLPGIAQGKEGSSEIYVRGGHADQNLLLLDGAPVYNLNHAFGVLSLFNTEAISKVTVQKGGIEARYGGRLSSVVDVNVREGNNQQFNGSFTMSVLGSSLVFEGPIAKNKSSFLVSARRSWADLLLGPIMSPSADVNQNLHFYDVNAKANFNMGKHNRLYFSIYSGADNMYVKANADGHQSKYSFGWGSHLASARWSHLLGSSVFAHLQLHASSYFDTEDFANKSANSNDYSNRQSRFNELGLKYNIDWQPAPLHRLSVGMEQQYREFMPGETKQRMNGQTKLSKSENVPMLQSALYIDHKWKPGAWQINPGLRFQYSGNSSWTHVGLEPRLSVAYKATDKATLKMSGMKTTQPLHAIHKTTMGWPGYFYVPSTNDLPPQTAWQLSAGAMFAASTPIHIDIDLWIKRYNHLLASYGAPATAFASSNWEELVSSGKGKAAGVDVLAEYNAPKFNARVSYTLSHAQTSFDDYYNGNWFDFDYDRRHDLLLTANKVIYERKKLSRSISTTFNYRSGNPFFHVSIFY